MTKQEIFKMYCKKYNYDLIKMYPYRPQVTDTFSYKLFELEIAIDELKQSIKDMITEIKLRIKGIVK